MRMTMLQVHGVQKEFQGAPILTNVSFQLTAGERVGLIGRNGCGKSSLMNILAGRLRPDGGSVHWMADPQQVAYLGQQDHFDLDRTLADQLTGADPDLLAKCGITAHVLEQPAGTLSGGQKTRAALARALSGNPQVLLLDEPTNHLDVDALRWLESVLTAFHGAVLVVSHDRFFLDQVATRMLELEGGQVKSYPGNYSAYAQQKRVEQERASAEYRQYRKEKAHLDAAMQRQTQWAQTGQNQQVEFGAPMGQKQYNRGQAKATMTRVKAMANRLARIKVEKPREAAQIHLKVEAANQVGRNLFLADDIGFRYAQNGWLFRHASFYVQRGDRIAIVGPNGAGKTTLIRLLLGALSPTEGRLYRAPLRVAYLAQEMENLHPEQTVLQEASGGNNALDQADVRSLLGCLLFSGESVLVQVKRLSGGEKVRLALAKILLSDPEVLVLDEPTNGLDLFGRERVEEALVKYTGTLLLISHDRYVLQRLANRVLSLEDSSLVAFQGDYQAFERRHGAAGREPAQAAHLDDALLLGEVRLAQISAALANPKPDEKERLNQEFIDLSRELRRLKTLREKG